MPKTARTPLPDAKSASYALELPERLVGVDMALISIGGIIYCHEEAEGLLYPLESVCRKVEIPGRLSGAKS